MGQSPDLRLIEAACYELAQHPDAALARRIDGYLDPIIAAIRGRKQKWSSEGNGDLLWAGNFLEASVAHFEATASRRLLVIDTPPAIWALARPAGAVSRTAAAPWSPAPRAAAGGGAAPAGRRGRGRCG